MRISEQGVKYRTDQPDLLVIEFRPMTLAPQMTKFLYVTNAISQQRMHQIIGDKSTRSEGTKNFTDNLLFRNGKVNFRHNDLRHARR